MRVADLFSGCGGLSGGFQAAGHEIVFAADRWSRAPRLRCEIRSCLVPGSRPKAAGLLSWSDTQPRETATGGNAWAARQNCYNHMLSVLRRWQGTRVTHCGGERNACIFPVLTDGTGEVSRRCVGAAGIRGRP